MAINVFASSLVRMSFQPGCSNEMVSFVNHEAIVEDDAVAAEMDSLIERGKLEGIKRVTVADKEAEIAKVEAYLAGLRAAADVISGNTQKVNTGTVDTTTMAAAAQVNGIATDRAGNTKAKQ